MMVIDRRYSVLERGEGHRAKQGREGDWEGWGGRIMIRFETGRSGGPH